jgi:Na+-driven multidrug efflux pump
LNVNSDNNIMNRIFKSWLSKGEIALFLTIMALAFVPSINDVIIVRLVAGKDIINVLGQIEWFDTINETMLAFLVMPLYYLLNHIKNDHKELRNRISQLSMIGFAIYLIFSIIILVYASTIADSMSAPQESVRYLQLETIGFVIGFVVSLLMVVFVIIGKGIYVTYFIVAKCMILVIGDISLIPDMGANGVAMTNIICNSILVVIGIYLLKKEELLQLKPRLDRQLIHKWIDIGKYSGGQIFLDNLIYILMICLMVNSVSQSGNYWIANSFIWGWLLIPIVALTEIIRRDYNKGFLRIKVYFFIVSLVILAWIITLPTWDFFISNVFKADESQKVLEIIYCLVPFYIAYAISVVFDNIFLSIGKTVYLFIISIFVNIVYYGALYIMFYANIIQTSMTFIILMFGFGMVIHMILSATFYMYQTKKYGITETDQTSID